MSVVSKLHEIDFSNQYSAQDALGRILLSLVAHPWDYARILMQLGYEPMRPQMVRTLFGSYRMAYPGIFRYLGYIYSIDGAAGMYRGIGHRLSHSLASAFVHANATHVFRQVDALVYPEDPIHHEDMALGIEFDTKRSKKRIARPVNEDSDHEEPSTSRIYTEKLKKVDEEGFTARRFRHFLRKLMCSLACEVTTLALTYPLRVLLVRSCAEFIGREKIYQDWPFMFFRFVDERGFYSGFTANLAANCLTLCASSTVHFIAEALIANKSVRTYVKASSTFIIQSKLYPFQLTSTVMAVNSCSSLLASKIDPPYLSWLECWNDLRRRHQLRRGSSLLWRYTVTLNVNDNRSLEKSS